MSGPVRGRVPTSQTACGLILVVALAIGLPGLARAGVRGLLFTGETIARHALAHSVVFVDGTRVDLRRVVTAASAHAFGDTDLLIHDLATGRTEIADADVAATAIVSPVESSAATIGELFVNAGEPCSMLKKSQKAENAALHDRAGRVVDTWWKDNIK